ncbi:adenylate/guanylate cyclase domain-containing protein [Treponema brennaborense]|uniref:Adenylate/guanylate cyclase n=1 Tax=Treponema brennaborense (strain DSM 12168 / CIP 105900 / DD5/3) TaxID=906968 RepID=F4LNM3_TREBD|nr:adenylate/guanylate cyclase domain-containing protein [Treponema brennaborense]AEE15877.1 adenylate/guanylate cyclase [Treponema brennaborense DSM 12168]
MMNAVSLFRKIAGVVAVSLFLIILSGYGRSIYGGTVIRNGELRVSFLNEVEQYQELRGKWFFWKDELLDPQVVPLRMADYAGPFMNVPGRWADTGVSGRADALSKGGTLALRLVIPLSLTGRTREWAVQFADANSSCSLTVVTPEGTVLASQRIGTPSFDPAEYVPAKGRKRLPFVIPPSDADTELILVMQVANFSTPYTGTWDKVSFGTERTLASLQSGRRVETSLICGAMLCMGLYHLCLYFLRKKDVSLLLFALICIFMTLRALLMGERMLASLLPETYGVWRFLFAAEHLSIHLCLPLFFFFFRAVYPQEMPLVPVKIVASISAVWVALEIFTPPMIHHRFLPWFEYVVVAGCIAVVVILIRAMIRKREGAFIIFSGLIVLAAAAVNDVLFSNGVIESVYMTSEGMLFFGFAQSFFLARRFSRLFVMVESYADELTELNRALDRFIPHEMLAFLDKKSIADIQYGDYTERRMTVLFLDIRSFTARSENMTPGETFRFINEFLAQFGPVVRENGGFIDKYLGDGFMALFPTSADDALAAALKMRRQLRLYNDAQTHSDTQAGGGEPVRIGIGIHTGQLMLGTIGENQRMDSTVISDTVNTASRMEQLTKKYETDILLSQNVVAELREPERYGLREIGFEHIRGKSVSVCIYAVEDA